jgi:hypothetical protein
MRERQVQETRLERFYAVAMHLYPPRFREAFAPAMRQAINDALNDRTLSRRTLVLVILKDLVVSLAKEHIAMLRDTFGRPGLVFNAVILAALATGLALALYTIPQQLLRLGANDPQIQLAGDLAAMLDRYGVTEGLRQGALFNSGAVVNMSRSLSPFLIVYNDQGQPLGSTAQLNGQTPTPPKGVFEYTRTHGEERLSWEPIAGSHDVRIAAVVVRVTGTQPGFVLGGRNMREVESRIALVGQLAALTWIGMLGVILVGTLVFGWYTRPKAA